MKKINWKTIGKLPIETQQKLIRILLYKEFLEFLMEYKKNGNKV